MATRLPTRAGALMLLAGLVFAQEPAPAPSPAPSPAPVLAPARRAPAGPPPDGAAPAKLDVATRIVHCPDLTRYVAGADAAPERATRAFVELMQRVPFDGAPERSLHLDVTAPAPRTGVPLVLVRGTQEQCRTVSAALAELRSGQPTEARL